MDSTSNELKKRTSLSKNGFSYFFPIPSTSVDINSDSSGFSKPIVIDNDVCTDETFIEELYKKIIYFQSHFVLNRKKTAGKREDPFPSFACVDNFVISYVRNSYFHFLLEYLNEGFILISRINSNGFSDSFYNFEEKNEEKVKVSENEKDMKLGEKEIRKQAERNSDFLNELINYRKEIIYDGNQSSSKIVYSGKKTHGNIEIIENLLQYIHPRGCLYEDKNRNNINLNYKLREKEENCMCDKKENIHFFPNKNNNEKISINYEKMNCNENFEYAYIENRMESFDFDAIKLLICKLLNFSFHLASSSSSASSSTFSLFFPLPVVFKLQDNSISSKIDWPTFMQNSSQKNCLGTPFDIFYASFIYEERKNNCNFNFCDEKKNNTENNSRSYVSNEKELLRGLIEKTKIMNEWNKFLKLSIFFFPAYMNFSKTSLSISNLLTTFNSSFMNSLFTPNNISKNYNFFMSNITPNDVFSRNEKRENTTNFEENKYFVCLRLNYDAQLANTNLRNNKQNERNNYNFFPSEKIMNNFFFLRESPAVRLFIERTFYVDSQHFFADRVHKQNDNDIKHNNNFSAYKNDYIYNNLNKKDCFSIKLKNREINKLYNKSHMENGHFLDTFKNDYENGEEKDIKIINENFFFFLKPNFMHTDSPIFHLWEKLKVITYLYKTHSYLMDSVTHISNDNKRESIYTESDLVRERGEREAEEFEMYFNDKKKKLFCSEENNQNSYLAEEHSIDNNNDYLTTEKREEIKLKVEKFIERELDFMNANVRVTRGVSRMISSVDIENRLNSFYLSLNANGEINSNNTTSNCNEKELKDENYTDGKLDSIYDLLFNKRVDTDFSDRLADFIFSFSPNLHECKFVFSLILFHISNHSLLKNFVKKSDNMYKIKILTSRDKEENLKVLEQQNKIKKKHFFPSLNKENNTKVAELLKLAIETGKCELCGEIRKTEELKNNYENEIRNLLNLKNFSFILAELGVYSMKKDIINSICQIDAALLSTLDEWILESNIKEKNLLYNTNNHDKHYSLLYIKESNNDKLSYQNYNVRVKIDIEREVDIVERLMRVLELCILCIRVQLSKEMITKIVKNSILFYYDHKAYSVPIYILHIESERDKTLSIQRWLQTNQNLPSSFDIYVNEKNSYKNKDISKKNANNIFRNEREKNNGVVFVANCDDSESEHNFEFDDDSEEELEKATAELFNRNESNNSSNRNKMLNRTQNKKCLIHIKFSQIPNFLDDELLNENIKVLFSHPKVDEKGNVDDVCFIKSKYGHLPLFLWRCDNTQNDERTKEFAAKNDKSEEQKVASRRVSMREAEGKTKKKCIKQKNNGVGENANNYTLPLHKRNSCIYSVIAARHFAFIS